MRKTKIIATIGPSSEDGKVIKEMVENGLNIARLNFSHRSQKDAKQTYKNLRKVVPHIGIIMDTQGPEVRLGKVKKGTELFRGEEVEFIRDKISGDEKKLSVDYPKLFDYLKKDDTILISDGSVELRVEKVGSSIKCRVIYGGKISTKKSVNIPGKNIGLYAPTKKDLDDIKFG
ncbi:MAG: pyruvate kinase, partial [candidate division WOR-3 bacterium]